MLVFGGAPFEQLSTVVGIAWANLCLSAPSRILLEEEWMFLFDTCTLYIILLSAVPHRTTHLRILILRVLASLRIVHDVDGAYVSGRFVDETIWVVLVFCGRRCLGVDSQWCGWNMLKWSLVLGFFFGILGFLDGVFD